MRKKVFMILKFKYLRIKSTSFYRKLKDELQKVEIKMNQNIEKIKK